MTAVDWADRLRQCVRIEEQAFDRDHTPLSDRQIANVVAALADHTALKAALRWAPDPDFEPQATSVGRWLHAVADALRDSEWRTS